MLKAWYGPLEEMAKIDTKANIKSEVEYGLGPARCYEVAKDLQSKVVKCDLSIKRGWNNISLSSKRPGRKPTKSQNRIEILKRIEFHFEAQLLTKTQITSQSLAWPNQDS